jgi:uncharacterized protein
VALAICKAVSRTALSERWSSSAVRARPARRRGFPEPLFAQNEAEHRIWRRDRISRDIREDLRDLEHVREISLIEHLTDMLPSKVGSPLSVKSLREDLQIDHKTAERWLQILENLYLCFRFSPYGPPFT